MSSDEDRARRPLERYEGIEQPGMAISRDPADPVIAWFTDPAGNIL